MLSEQGRALAYCCACKDAGQPIDPDQTVKAFFKGMLLAWCSLAIASLGGRGAAVSDRFSCCAIYAG